MEIDSALTAIQTLRSGLQDAKMAAVNAQLKPLPGESVSGSYFKLEAVFTGFPLISGPTMSFFCPLFSFTSVGKVCSRSGQHLEVGGVLHGSAAHVRCTRE